MNKRRIAQFITALCVCFTLIFGLLTPGTVYAAKVIKTKHTGSLKDPIPVGETYTTKGTSNYLGQDLTATYSLTVKSSKDISKKTMKKMGLRVADDDLSTNWLISQFL